MRDTTLIANFEEQDSSEVVVDVFGSGRVFPEEMCLTHLCGSFVQVFAEADPC